MKIEVNPEWTNARFENSTVEIRDGQPVKQSWIVLTRHDAPNSPPIPRYRVTHPDGRVELVHDQDIPCAPIEPWISDCTIDLMSSWIDIRCLNPRLPIDGTRVLAMYKDVYPPRVVTFWVGKSYSKHFGHPSTDQHGSQPATHWSPIPPLPT